MHHRAPQTSIDCLEEGSLICLFHTNIMKCYSRNVSYMPILLLFVPALFVLPAGVTFHALFLILLSGLPSGLLLFLICPLPISLGLILASLNHSTFP